MSTFQFSIDGSKPRNTFSLNGRWQLCGGTASQIPTSFPSTVPVPAVVDTADPPYDWQSFDYHWYRTEFQISGISNSSFSLLTIEQSMFGTEVWLNGTHLGGSISCYTSHQYALDRVLKKDSVNELIVRVGAKRTLPPESAVGRDQEKDIYTPGIWGTVHLSVAGSARIRNIQTIPHIETAVAEVRVTLENLGVNNESFLVSTKIIEKKSRRVASGVHNTMAAMTPGTPTRVSFSIPIDQMKLWSPESPFLYEVESVVQKGKAELDVLSATFGMREFRVSGSDFYLNGKKILLRGGNIAFHRFLSDSQRKLLPWDEEWIKKLLIDIPKEHHFNFFRNHLGQMYNRWYDIADEHGMLLQNEWQFWCTTGTDRQIRKEFTEWLQDNWNHPSIIIWDPLNESSDETVQREIVPAMKELDPSRPWESVDFLEDHPYIYSIGMVMNDRKFGFTRSLEEIERLPVPSMVNEFLWWWFNDRWEPTVLTKDIVERWMGKEYTKEDIIAHQSFLGQELIELFRRLRIKAIQPFVYLSNNNGPTAHWFLGDIKDLQPKPLMQALKNAFAPFAVSIEIWDRHFFVDEQRLIRFFVFNDSNEFRKGTLRFGIKDQSSAWLTTEEISMSVAPMSDSVIEGTITFPQHAGSFAVSAEIEEKGSIVSTSTKPAFVFVKKIESKIKNKIILFDRSEEIKRFCISEEIPFSDFQHGLSKDSSVLVVNGNSLQSDEYSQRIKEISEFVTKGGMVVLIEPEFRVVGVKEIEIVEGVVLRIAQRHDVDKGGYDSYVFAEERSHPLWHGIERDHLKMFNGGYGGEIVSEYTVDFSVESQVLARCGINLAVTAVSQIEVGKGKIVMYRLQLRGRLRDSPSSSLLYGRRADPVAQQLLVNILNYR